MLGFLRWKEKPTLDHFCFVFRFEKFRPRNHTNEGSDVNIESCTQLFRNIWPERISLGHHLKWLGYGLHIT